MLKRVPVFVSSYSCVGLVLEVYLRYNHYESLINREVLRLIELAVGVHR